MTNPILIVNKCGDKAWYQNDQRHREDGPAIEYANGDKYWYRNGLLHREDGPAIEYADGDKLWYQNDQRLSEKEFEEMTNPIVNEYGDKEWYRNGQLHREDGPAVECANGDKVWWLNGQVHREDGPAIEYADGDKAWWLNDQLHREDGPAVEYADGDKEWYQNGQRLSEKEIEEMKKNNNTQSNDFRHQMIEALISHANGHIQKHRMNVEVYLNNSAGIGEHSDVLDAIEGELKIISEYHEQIEMLKSYF